MTRRDTLKFWIGMALAGVDLPAEAAPPQYEDAAIGCVALVVFSEARGEDLFAQAVVASTVVERARRDGEGLCAEALRPHQFEGLDAWGLPREPWKIDASAWRNALDVSAAVAGLDYEIPPPCGGSLYFHDLSIARPSWARTLLPTCRLGNLQFYAQPAVVQVAQAAVGPKKRAP